MRKLLFTAGLVIASAMSVNAQVLAPTAGNAVAGNGVECCGGAAGFLATDGVRDYLAGSSHVFGRFNAAPEGNYGDYILDPSLLETDCDLNLVHSHVGNLQSYSTLLHNGQPNTADFAIALLLPGYVRTDVTKFASNFENTPFVGEFITMTGPVSGTVLGHIVQIGYSFSLDESKRAVKACKEGDTSQPFIFTNTIVASMLSAGGDSGAPVLTWAASSGCPQLIGNVISGGKTPDGTIVTLVGPMKAAFASVTTVSDGTGSHPLVPKATCSPASIPVHVPVVGPPPTIIWPNPKIVPPLGFSQNQLVAQASQIDEKQAQAAQQDALDKQQSALDSIDRHRDELMSKVPNSVGITIGEDPSDASKIAITVQTSSEPSAKTRRNAPTQIDGHRVIVSKIPTITPLDESDVIHRHEGP